jgi:hypothetical protein
LAEVSRDYSRVTGLRGARLQDRGRETAISESAPYGAHVSERTDGNQVALVTYTAWCAAQDHFRAITLVNIFVADN